MPILLTQQSTEISPIVIIIFVAFVIVIAFASMKSQSKSSVKGIKKKYNGRIVEECPLSGDYSYCFVTEDELVLQNDQNSFKAFKLNSIKYVHSYRDISTKRWAFSVSDENKKGLKGELLGGTNAARKFNHATLFFMPQEDADKLCEFVMKHASHVEKAES